MAGEVQGKKDGGEVMRDVLLRKMMMILSEVRKNGVKIEDGWGDQGYDGDGFSQTQISAVEFLKECAMEAEDYELVGVAESIIKKYEECIDEEYGAYGDYHDSLFDELFENKSYYSATDIGMKVLNFSSGRQANKVLESLGYQVRQDGGWVATEKADGLCKQINFGGSQKPYIKWKKDIFDILKKEI